MLHADELEDVLTQPRYWSVPFCRNLLDSYDEQTLDEPYRARRWAETGLKLVARVEEATGVEQPVLRARATAVLGTSYRVIGDAKRADELYGEALRLYHDLDAPLDRADLRRRIGYLRMEQRRFDDALAELEAARDVFQAGEDEEGLGLVLMATGHVYQELGDTDRALLRLVKALPMLEKSKRPKAVRIVIQNIAGTLATSVELATTTLNTAIALVRKSRAKRGSRYGHRACTLPDAKARWVLGLLYWRIPKLRPRALKLLESALEDLVILGALLDVVMLSLDLGTRYAQKKRWNDLEKLAAEALRLLGHVPGSAEATAAYRLWLEAVVARQAEKLAELTESCRAKLVGLRGAAEQRRAP